MARDPREQLEAFARFLFADSEFESGEDGHSWSGTLHRRYLMPIAKSKGNPGLGIVKQLEGADAIVVDVFIATALAKQWLSKNVPLHAVAHDLVATIAAEADHFPGPKKGRPTIENRVEVVVRNSARKKGFDLLVQFKAARIAKR